MNKCAVPLLKLTFVYAKNILEVKYWMCRCLWYIISEMKRTIRFYFPLNLI